jgi:hypothetical protein
MTRSVVHLVVLAAILGWAAGCSGSRPKTIQLSGKVTFKGQPVPAGYLSFLPDASQGGRGEVRVVQIKDGVYDSSREKNPGLYPGPTLIRIGGFDGKPLHRYPQGKQIFNPYEVRETVAEGTKDFEVPASAAHNLIITPTADE